MPNHNQLLHDTSSYTSTIISINLSKKSCVRNTMAAIRCIAGNNEHFFLSFRIRNKVLQKPWWHAPISVQCSAKFAHNGIAMRSPLGVANVQHTAAPFYAAQLKVERSFFVTLKSPFHTKAFCIVRCARCDVHQLMPIAFVWGR